MNENKTDRKSIGNKGITESLSHEQRKELIGLMKRMLPPVPSKGIIDIRFAFWFFQNWYIVLIFGKDTRKQFKALDKGDMDRSLTTVAKIFTYLFMLVSLLIVFLILLYFLKSAVGIDLFPDTHFPDMLMSLL